MYIGYKIEDYCGQTYINPICILKNEKDVEKYNAMSTDNAINFEECNILDLDKINKIRYVDIVYKSKDDKVWKECVTNDFETKNVKDINRVTIFNGCVHIKKILNDNEKSKIVADKLLEMCPHLAFKKDMNEVTNYEDTGIRMNGVYVEIDIDDFLKSMQYT